MKPATFTLLLFSFCLIFTSSCVSSRKLAKGGSKLEEQGMYSEAADYYLESLRKNNNNTEARIGLKRTGQRVLDDQMERFYKAFAMEDNRTAVVSYMEAENYYNQLNALSVNVSYPHHYKGYFEEAKIKYLASTYEQGNSRLTEKDFSGAEQLFRDILNVDPRYKDTKELHKISRLEPIYERAEADMDKGQFKAAYRKFDKIIREDSHYKHATHLKSVAQKEAQLTVGLVPAKGTTQEKMAGDKINALILQRMVNDNNPFLKVVDRSNMDAIIDEQKLGLSGVVDENTAAEAGQLIGVKTVLLGKIIRFEENEGRLYKQTKNAWEQYTVRVYDKTTQTYRNITKYRRASYQEFKRENSVHITYQFQLVSSETGEVLATQLYDKIDRDEINYAEYSGNNSRICANPNSANFYSETQRIRRLCKADRNIESTTSLLKGLYNGISRQVSDEITSYEKQRN